MDSPPPETLEQLRAENQCLRAQIAALDARTESAAPVGAVAVAGPPIWFDTVSDAIFVADPTWHIQHWNQAAEQLYGWSPAEAVGRPISDLIAVVRYLDGDSDAVAAQTLLTTGSWRGTFVQRTRDGREVVVEGATRTLADAQATLMGYIGINRDVTARTRAAQALQHTAKRLQIQADIARSFAEAGTEYHAALDQAVRTIAEVLAGGCVVSLISDDGQWLDPVAFAHVDSARGALLQRALVEAREPLDAPTPGARVVQTGQPILVPRIYPEQVRATTTPEQRSLLEHLAIQSMLVVPMRTQGQTIGVISLFHHRQEPRPFDEDDRSLAQDLADRAAMLIANARLHQQAQQDLADRAQAEINLRASETRYRLLFETMAQGVVYLDLDGQMSAANPAAERILGLTESQLQGLTPRDPRWRAIDADGRPFPGDEHPVMVALRTGHEIRDVVMGVYHPGLDAYRWITIQAVPYARPGEATPAHVYAIFSDITDLRQSQQTLEYERQQLAAILNTMHEGVIASRPDGTLALINPAALRLRDLDPAHPPTQVMGLGQTPHQLLDACGRPVAQRDLPLFRVLRGERFADLELCLRALSDGQERWHLINGTPVYDPDGTLRLGVITFKDITDSKRDEALLRQQAAMLDHAHVLIRDTESRITFWNQGAQRLYGWTAEEALGRASHELLQTRFPTSLDDVQAELFATGRWEGELVHRRRDTSAVVVASLWVLFRDASGAPSHVLA